VVTYASVGGSWLKHDEGIGARSHLHRLSDGFVERLGYEWLGVPNV
jgi:hypothetical protein